MEQNALLTSLWDKVLQDIEKEVSRGNFVTLIKPTTLLSLDEDIATIAAPSAMIIDLLQKRFKESIKKSLDTHTGRENDILFIQKAVVVKPLDTTDEKNGPLFTQVTKPLVQTIGHPPRVRADYTFENFAVSGSNQLAFESAKTVARKIGAAYNPLFIYGPVGVGKTHLMHAVANFVYQNDPDKKIIYITSEEFTNEVVEAIRGNDTSRMKKRFRTASLLIIDDIQFIEGKERVQEELFHTFNILIDNGAQICLSSDRPPHEIKKLEKRLSSRFAGGLTVDIESPDFELKTAILLKKAEKFGHEMPIDAAKLLANNVTDTRSLEGHLLRIITQAATTNEPITVALVHKVLGAKPDRRPEHLHTEDVIKSVCDFYAIKPTQLKGPKRDASLVKARQITMYLLKTELGLTLVEIGNALGGRDHTTVMHGVEKIEKMRTSASHVSEDIMGITNKLRG